MNKSKLPAIRLATKPTGLSLKTPASALARWDKTLRAAAKQSDGVCAIDVMGEIGDSGWGAECTTAVMVKNQLQAAGKAPVLLTINSPGGDAFEGIAIYNLLRDHPRDVTVNVIGLAASAASIVAMGGDKITMGESAFMMIHSSWGLVMGNRNDLLEFADMLDKVDTSVAELYARRSGMPVADVLTLMEEETWMTAAEAVKNGFADSTIATKKTNAATPKTVFAQTPVVLLAAPGVQARPAVRLSAPTPGATGTPSNPKGIQMETIIEQIAALEAKRAASSARREKIQSDAIKAGRTKDASEKEEFDTLSTEIGTIDAELVDLRLMQSQSVVRATAITAVVAADPAASSASRGGAVANSGIISVKANVEKGIAFTRYVKALIASQGNPQLAVMYAEANRAWMDTTPEVAKALKVHMAAVAGGDTTTAGWASEIVYKENLIAEFIELLRPQTILGKLSGLTRVPFNVRMGSQTSGSSASWVGQGKAAPVSKLGTSEVTLGIAKAAGLVVLTEELVRSSQPSAELLVRNDLMKTIAQFLDQQFIDPNYAPVANVSPGSVTYGVTGLQPTGTNYAAVSADVQTTFGTFISANLDPTGCVWIMPPTRALALSMMQNALSQPQFPKITMQGGEFFGLPVITSMSANVTASPDAGDLMVLANAPEILMADDGQIEIDASREATIEQSTAPVGDAAAGTAQTQNMVSMFQSNSVAIRATRFINWKKRRTTAVAFIHAALYA